MRQEKLPKVSSTWNSDGNDYCLVRLVEAGSMATLLWAQTSCDELLHILTAHTIYIMYSNIIKWSHNI